MLTFENVGLRYGVGAETLRDVNFQIEPRSFQFLTGPSGAGKTTLLRLIIMALQPTRGLINIFGKDTAALEQGRRHRRRAAKSGVVFQDFRLLDHLTLYENVALPLARARARRVDLSRRGGRTVALGGPRRARACVPNRPFGRREAARGDRPRADLRSPNCCWPTSRPAMSTPLSRAGCCASSSNSTRSGTAVVIATHDLSLMDQYEDARRLVLADGRLHIFE